MCPEKTTYNRSLKTLAAALALLFVVTPLAAKVYIDYDPEALNKDYKTFAWRFTNETSLAETNPLAHSRIMYGIEHYLTRDGGVYEDRDSPDVWVTYHTSSKEELQLDTDTWGYGYGSSWRWGGYYSRYGGMPMASTTTVRSYTEGTVVIDLWDAKTNKLVWRGQITTTVPSSPTKAEKKFDKELAKLVNKWQKMRAKF